MLLHVASGFTLAEGAALVALVSAIVGGFVMVRKLGPERGALFITQAQGANLIMDNVVETLRKEVERCYARIAVLEAENEALREEAVGLRRHKGRRRGEGDG